VWSRDLVEAHLEVGGERVVVLATHLVSRLFADSDARRRRQAERAREVADRVARAHAGATVLVTGDLNDEPRSWALAPLLGDGAWVSATSGRVPPDDAWTYSHPRYGRSTVDYVVVSRAAARRVVAATILPDPDGAGREWDHRPVVVDLDLRR
jgi:endonuclease/exonuclease/phosphatase family metal-dependent hydrolase